MSFSESMINEIVVDNFPEDFTLCKQVKINHYIDRTKFKEKVNMCHARIWNGGLGGQCSRTQCINNLCNLHNNIVEIQGSWWLGYITETRPERPIYTGPNNDKCEYKKWRE